MSILERGKWYRVRRTEHTCWTDCKTKKSQLSAVWFIFILSIGHENKQGTMHVFFKTNLYNLQTREENWKSSILNKSDFTWAFPVFSVRVTLGPILTYMLLVNLLLFQSQKYFVSAAVYQFAFWQTSSSSHSAHPSLHQRTRRERLLSAAPESPLATSRGKSPSLTRVEVLYLLITEHLNP